MKNHLLSLLFTAIAGAAIAQPFSLFTENTAKDFAPLDETWERNYSLKIDSLMENEGISEFFLHTVMNENENADFEPGSDAPEECYGWGGCFENSGPTGFGTKVYSEGSAQYLFINLNGDTLHFDFNADSAVFFENSQEVYALVFENEIEQTVFGTTEQVRTYRISHYDTGGNDIVSPLHGSTISVGESIGLINFFYVDEFPQTEIPLTLIGDADLDQSLAVFTGEMIHDFEVGDTIQYKVRYFESNPSNPNGPNEVISYLNRIFVSRDVEVDSLRYTVLHQSFGEGATNLTEWTEEQVYPRFDTLSAIPFYRRRFTDGHQDASYRESLFKRDFCGDIHVGLKGISGPIRYCESHDAWCGFDTNGPPEITQFEYVPGLGRVIHRVARNGFETETTWVQSTEMVYFSKGGTGCGEEAILSAENANRPDPKFTVYPNPATTILHFKLDRGPLAQAGLFDLQGRRVLDMQLNQAEPVLNVARLPKGMYMVKAVGVDGTVYTSKVMVMP